MDDPLTPGASDAPFTPSAFEGGGGGGDAGKSPTGSPTGFNRSGRKSVHFSNSQKFDEYGDDEVPKPYAGRRHSSVQLSQRWGDPGSGSPTSPKADAPNYGNYDYGNYGAGTGGTNNDDYGYGGGSNADYGYGGGGGTDFGNFTDYNYNENTTYDYGGGGGGAGAYKYSMASVDMDDFMGFSANEKKNNEVEEEPAFRMGDSPEEFTIKADPGSLSPMLDEYYNRRLPNVTPWLPGPGMAHHLVEIEPFDDFELVEGQWSPRMLKKVNGAPDDEEEEEEEEEEDEEEEEEEEEEREQDSPKKDQAEDEDPPPEASPNTEEAVEEKEADTTEAAATSPVKKKKKKKKKLAAKEADPEKVHAALVLQHYARGRKAKDDVEQKRSKRAAAAGGGSTTAAHDQQEVSASTSPKQTFTDAANAWGAPEGEISRTVQVVDMGKAAFEAYKRRASEFKDGPGLFAGDTMLPFHQRYYAYFYKRFNTTHQVVKQSTCRLTHRLVLVDVITNHLFHFLRRQEQAILDLLRAEQHSRAAIVLLLNAEEAAGRIDIPAVRWSTRRQVLMKQDEDAKRIALLMEVNYFAIQNWSEPFSRTMICFEEQDYFMDLEDTEQEELVEVKLEIIRKAEREDADDELVEAEDNKADTSQFSASFKSDQDLNPLLNRSVNPRPPSGVISRPWLSQLSSARTRALLSQDKKKDESKGGGRSPSSASSSTPDVPSPSLTPAEHQRRQQLEKQLKDAEWLLQQYTHKGLVAGAKAKLPGPTVGPRDVEMAQEKIQHIKAQLSQQVANPFAFVPQNALTHVRGTSAATPAKSSSESLSAVPAVQPPPAPGSSNLGSDISALFRFDTLLCNKKKSKKPLGVASSSLLPHTDDPSTQGVEPSSPMSPMSPMSPQREKEEEPLQLQRVGNAPKCFLISAAKPQDKLGNRRVPVEENLVYHSSLLSLNTTLTKQRPTTAKSVEFAPGKKNALEKSGRRPARPATAATSGGYRPRMGSTVARRRAENAAANREEGTEGE